MPNLCPRCKGEPSDTTDIDQGDSEINVSSQCSEGDCDVTWTGRFVFQEVYDVNDSSPNTENEGDRG